MQNRALLSCLLAVRCVGFSRILGSFRGYRPSTRLCGIASGLLALASIFIGYLAASATPQDVREEEIRKIDADVLALLYQAVTANGMGESDPAVDRIIKLDLKKRLQALDEFARLMTSHLPSLRYIGAKRMGEVLHGTAAERPSPSGTVQIKGDIYVRIPFDAKALGKDPLWDRDAYVRIFNIKLAYKIYHPSEEGRDLYPKINDWWSRRRKTYIQEQQARTK